MQGALISSDTEVTLKEKQQSAQHEIIASRMFVYPWIWGDHSEKDLKQMIADYHKQGVDGLKFGMMDQQVFLSASKLANQYKLPVANH